MELSDGSVRTELDAIVLTHRGAWIVEIKNTRKNVFIDEHGQYYRTGEYLRWDSDIGQKMRVKTGLLVKWLHDQGYDIPIKCIVLFSNNRIEVQNKYKQLTTCFLSQLNHLIEGNTADEVLETEEINELAERIDSIVGTDQYPIKTDVAKMKRDYAALMAKLEMGGKARQASGTGLAPEHCAQSLRQRKRRYCGRCRIDHDRQNGSKKPPVNLIDRRDRHERYSWY